MHEDDAHVERTPLTTALDAIVGFTERARFETMPAAVVEQAKRLLLDGIGGMAMGARKEEGRQLTTAEQLAHPTGLCTVVGTSRKVALADAVFLNAALAQVHDCNDVRRLARRDGGTNHPGRGVIPVALALAEHNCLSGSALLELLVIGYEVACHAGVKLPGHEYCVAVAAMVGRAEGMRADAARSSLVFAHLSFPTQAAWPDSTDFDFLKNGLIARAAVASTALAAAGFTAPTERLDLTLATPFPQPDSRAESYAIMNVSCKPYPCCRSLHGAIDLALELVKGPDIRLADIAGVEVRVGNSQKRVYQPVTPDTHYKACQFSIPYVTGCALLDGKVDDSTFSRSRIAASDVQEMQAKIRVERDARLSYNPSGPASLLRPTVLTATTTDGRTITRATLSPKGSRLNPLSEAEHRDKFWRWTGSCYSDRLKEEIVRRVTNLEREENAAAFVSLLGAEASGGPEP